MFKSVISPFFCLSFIYFIAGMVSHRFSCWWDIWDFSLNVFQLPQCHPGSLWNKFRIGIKLITHSTDLIHETDQLKDCMCLIFSNFELLFSSPKVEKSFKSWAEYQLFIFMDNRITLLHLAANHIGWTSGYCQIITFTSQGNIKNIEHRNYELF